MGSLLISRILLTPMPEYSAASVNVKVNFSQMGTGLLSFFKLCSHSFTKILLKNHLFTYIYYIFGSPKPEKQSQNRLQTSKLSKVTEVRRKLYFSTLIIIPGNCPFWFETKGKITVGNGPELACLVRGTQAYFFRCLPINIVINHTQNPTRPNSHADTSPVTLWILSPSRLSKSLYFLYRSFI